VSQTKEEKRAHDRAYYASHKEEFASYSLAYRESHKKETRDRAAAYYIANKDKIISRCKQYTQDHRAERRAYDRAYRIANHERITAQDRAYYDAHKEEARAGKQRRMASPEKREQKRMTDRAYRLQSAFGLSLAEYDALLHSQSGVCAICKKPRPNGKGLHVDHDHADGRVRSLLCYKCNSALGYINDDPAIANAMTAYLLKHNAASHAAKETT
jgi:hypothetical protein